MSELVPSVIKPTRVRKRPPVKIGMGYKRLIKPEKPHLAEVIRWVAVDPKDDSVMVFDSRGLQVPELQGLYSDPELRQRIKERGGDTRTRYKLGWWCSQVFRTIGRTEWLEGRRE
jgi:hypothetical protein